MRATYNIIPLLDSSSAKSLTRLIRITVIKVFEYGRIMSKYFRRFLYRVGVTRLLHFIQDLDLYSISLIGVNDDFNFILSLVINDNR